ncbi:MAG: right-handed parallel beta-helix repeat-containing protein [Methanolinea sp.]|nr:right-handed parallel beta-helix repeat-containing protein [Methanolinea sp.]
MPVAAETWTVCPSGCNFTSIQEAINAASAGDTILVMAGEFHELVVVNKTIVLRGENANTSVINGDYSGNVLTITADGVRVENIQVKGSIRKSGGDIGFGIGVDTACNVTIDSCIVTDNQFGIFTNNTSGLVITRNEVLQNDLRGMLLYSTSLTTCSENYVHDNGSGIFADGSRGFSCLNNKIVHNKYGGLAFFSISKDIMVEGNLIQDNVYVDFKAEDGDVDSSGGYFGELDNVTIRGNQFIHNGGIGFSISEMSNSLVDGNVMERNYAGFSYGDNNPYPGNNVTLSNTVDGLPVLYLERVNDRDITGSGYATIYLVGCRNITVHDTNITSRNGFGILARGGERIYVRNNSVSNSIFQNILLMFVTDAEIVSNHVQDAGYGIGVLASSSVNVTKNHAMGHSKAGLAAALTGRDLVFAQNILERTGGGLGFEYYRNGSNTSAFSNRITGFNPEYPMSLGTYILRSDNIMMWNNEISGMYEGVFVGGGQSNVLEENIVEDCRFGIQISPLGGTGVTIPACNNRVIHNDVSAEKIAFFISGLHEYVYSNHIFLNNFTSIEERPSEEDPEISAGLRNAHPAIPVAWGLSRSSEFMPEGGSIGTEATGENAFHTDTPVIYEFRGKVFKGYLGNHWNWYRGTDTDGNGVGTTPYSVFMDNSDRYPLLSPVSEYHRDPTPSFYADFDADPISGEVPLSVEFTDCSKGNPSRYLYRFGDGFMSMSKNPVHTYLKPGNYTVSLTIWKIDGRNLVNATTIRAGYITVEKKTEPEVRIDFTGTPLTGKAPLTVSFTGTSSVPPILWKYSFGDGFMATQQNSTHTYRRPGTYNVTLTTWTMGPDKIPVTHKVEKPAYITVT